MAAADRVVHVEERANGRGEIHGLSLWSGALCSVEWGSMQCGVSLYGSAE